MYTIWTKVQVNRIKRTVKKGLRAWGGNLGMRPMWSLGYLKSRSGINGSMKDR